MSSVFSNEIWGVDPTGKIRPVWVEDLSPDCELALTPTVGCFTLGYLLAVPEEEVPSFARLSRDYLIRTESLIQTYAELINEFVGDIIVAEHGAISCAKKGAACIDHAHLHLVPMPGLIDAVEDEYRRVGGAPSCTIDRLEDLPHAVGDRAYIYLATRFPGASIWLNVERFPSQFVRRVCANLLGIPERFDWRKAQFRDLMEFSAESLGAVIEGHRLFTRYREEGPKSLSMDELSRLEVALRRANPFQLLATERNVEKLILIAATNTKHASEAAIDQIHALWSAGLVTPEMASRLRQLMEAIIERQPYELSRCAAKEFLETLG